jgi:hypothetical protein
MEFLHPILRGVFSSVKWSRIIEARIIEARIGKQEL